MWNRNIKILFTGLFFLSCIVLAYAQVPTNIEPDKEEGKPGPPVKKEKKHLIAGKMEYSVGSDAITNAFIDAAFSKGIIERDEKQQVFDRLDEKNRLGYQLDYGFLYAYEMKKYRYHVGIKSSEHFNAGFNKNLFQLVFEGNKNFAGQHINLAPFKYTYFSYEQLSFGFDNLTETNKQLNFFSSLNILKGSRFHQAILENGDFFTDSLGTSIDFDVDMDFVYADESKKKLGSFNGMGASIDLMIIYKPKNHKGYFSFHVVDLGLISWSGLDAYQIDEDYNFSGIEVTDFFESTDSLFSGAGFESMSDLLGVENTKNNKTYFLPAKIYFDYKYLINSHLQANIGLNHQFNSFYVPRISGSLRYEVWKYLDIAPVISYGGYNKFDYGLVFSSKIYDLYYLQLAFHFLEDWIQPNSSGGQGLSIRGYYYF